MPYRLLALDLDGTLLDRSKRISRANRDAVRRAQQAGLRVIICTARIPHTARPFAEQIGATQPMIACVGAWSIMPDGRDDQTCFDTEIVRRFADFADAEGLNLSITAADARMRLRWADHEQRRELPEAVLPFVEIVPRFDGRVPERAVRIFSGETRSAERLLAAFGDELRGRVRFYRTSEDGVVRELHVVPGAAGKGQALRRICAELGIEQAEVAAAGDSETDLEMIRWAGLGIAVADAMPEVHAAADLVAPACDDDAVAWIVSHVLEL
jgi:hypothetical protein